ncbi:MAG: hypothetical protein AAB316_08085, partial [Bacteroidota bacterium]
IVRTTVIREDEIAELAEKSPKIKNAIMKTYDVWDYVREMEAKKSKKVGREEGRQEAFEEMTIALVRKGMEKKFTPEVIEDVYGIPLQKVMEIIASLKAQENGGHNKN